MLPLSRVKANFEMCRHVKKKSKNTTYSIASNNFLPFIALLQMASILVCISESFDFNEYILLICSHASLILSF